MKKMTTSIAYLAILILVAGCHSTKPVSAGATGGSEMLFRYQWDVTELEGHPIVISSGNQPHLLFYPGQVSRVSGSTGCNKLNGSFELTGVNFIKFSPLATTKMACIENNLEQQFIEAIGQVNNWSIIDKQLLLLNGRITVAKLNAVNTTINPIVMPTPASSNLNGTWELNYISGPRIAFDGLYPEKKPQITFGSIATTLTGNTSCNNFSTTLSVNRNNITIHEPVAITKMSCGGSGEITFLNMLKKINKYAVTDGNLNTLAFMIDDVAVMRFTKK